MGGGTGGGSGGVQLVSFEPLVNTYCTRPFSPSPAPQISPYKPIRTLTNTHLPLLRLLLRLLLLLRPRLRRINQPRLYLPHVLYRRQVLTVLVSEYVGVPRLAGTAPAAPRLNGLHLEI